MSIIEEIRVAFKNLLPYKSIKIENSDINYPCLAFRTFDEYGVIFKISAVFKFYECATGIKLRTERITINDITDNYLFLSSDNYVLVNQFAILCANFVEPGLLGENRLAISNDPKKWWDDWKDLLGNTTKNLRVYDLIGELYSLSYLYNEKEDVVWGSANLGTHDIESSKAFFEVKSTIKKYENTITVNSKNQFSLNKKGFLFFVRLEKSKLGFSINDIIENLRTLNFDVISIERRLKKIGYLDGKPERNEKYIILNFRKYPVDDEFPVLRIQNIEESIIKERLLNFQYTVDISGLKFEEIVYNLNLEMKAH